MLRKDNLAELLSFLRGVVFMPLAVAGIIVGAWKGWDGWWALALIAVGLAAFSDRADGWCYNRWGCRRRWFGGDNGKVSNDRANAYFSVAVPLAMVIAVCLGEWLDWPDFTGNVPWHELWLWWGFVMVAGTLLCNHVKTTFIIDEALPAEVMQGLLQCLILLSLALQCSYFAFGNSRVAYYSIAVVSVLLLLWSRDRWFGRVESDYSDDRSATWSRPVNPQNP